VLVARALLDDMRDSLTVGSAIWAVSWFPGVQAGDVGADQLKPWPVISRTSVEEPVREPPVAPVMTPGSLLEGGAVRVTNPWEPLSALSQRACQAPTQCKVSTCATCAAPPFWYPLHAFAHSSHVSHVPCVSRIPACSYHSCTSVRLPQHPPPLLTCQHHLLPRLFLCFL
jgi:hypothetical protein